MSLIFLAAALVTSLFILVAVYRILSGKNIPERIVALDVINTLVVILMVILGTYYKKALYIDIGIVYGILSFVGTLYIARYLSEEKKR